MSGFEESVKNKSSTSCDLVVLKKLKDPPDDDADYRFIELTHGKRAIVDAELFDDLNKYHWQARKSFSRWYAMRKVVSNGREFWIRMHRQIMNTPRDQITHHKNRNTMDNRRANLVNMTQRDHRFLHQNTFPRLIKREKTSEETGDPYKKEQPLCSQKVNNDRTEHQNTPKTS